MTTKILRNVSLFLIFVIPFIPLYVDNSLFFPFITGKAFAFRIIVEIITALWLALLLRDRKYAPKFSWLSLGITIFTLAILVSDLAGVNPLKSFWSNFERMEGWITIVHLWMYFTAVTSIFGAYENDKKTVNIWHAFFNANIIAALIVGFYGVYQLFHPESIHQGSSRIDASLGNAAYMAVYMLINTFLSLYMSFFERAKKKIALSWWYIVSAVFFGFILFETGTRGTILGLIGGIMLTLALYAVFGKRQSKKSRWISGGAIIGIILLGGLFYVNRNLPFIQHNEVLQRLASISIKDTQTQARGYIWPVAIKGAFQNPKTAIIGWGQENFNYIFNANYNPAMWTQEQWFDRAHSVYLDWLVAGGLVGIILYLSLFVIATVLIWKSQKISFIEKTVLTGMIAAYAVHNIFVFDNLISYILFFMILGFIHSSNAKKHIGWLMIREGGTKEQMETRVTLRDYVYIPVVVIVSIGVFYFINVKPIEANTSLIKAMTACSNGGTPSADLYEKGLELNQYVANQESREQLLACAGAVSQGDFSPQSKNDFYNLSKKEIAAQIQATPNDARAYILGGSFFDNVGDWGSATPLLEKAYELSPKKQTIMFELATNYMNSNKQKEALDLMQKAYESAPENPTSQEAYLTLLLLTGQDKKAQDLFGNKPELFNDPRVVSVYIKLKEYDKAIAIYKNMIAKDPTNPQLQASLAAAYYANGEQSLSIATLRDMETKFTTAKPQLENAIKDIQDGKNPFQ